MEIMTLEQMKLSFKPFAGENPHGLEDDCPEPSSYLCDLAINIINIDIIVKTAFNNNTLSNTLY
jgi:hypothetical protein